MSIFNSVNKIKENAIDLQYQNFHICFNQLISI